jgi:SAM-dependent methyltransferase
MTRYLDRVLAGEAPTVDEWNEHLVTYHHAHRGWSEGWISRMRTSDGETSLDLLLRRIRETAPQAQNFLDIGCGDGKTLERIGALYTGVSVSLTGIDLSAEQIEAALARVPAASLRLGDASTDLKPESYDVVAAHMSFMAMADTLSIARAVRTALRNGGIFACVCEDPLGAGAVFGVMAKAIGLLRASWPELSFQVPGRAAIEKDDVLRDLLVSVGFQLVSIEHFAVGIRADVDQMWGFVVDSYMLGLLDEDIRDDLRKRLDGQLHDICASNSEITLALRLVLAYA